MIWERQNETRQASRAWEWRNCYHLRGHLRCEKDYENSIFYDDQEPILKNLISTGNPLTKLKEQEKQRDDGREYSLSWKVANEKSKQLLVKKLKERIEMLEEEEQSYPNKAEIDKSLEESDEEADWTCTLYIFAT